MDCKDLDDIVDAIDDDFEDVDPDDFEPEHDEYDTERAFTNPITGWGNFSREFF